MFNLILLLLLKEKRSLFVNKFSYAARVGAIIINFLFYYFSAKAFSPNPSIFSSAKGQWDLFEFVIIGELILFFALDSLIVFSIHIKNIINNGLLDSLLNTRTSLERILFNLSSATLIWNSLSLVIQISIYTYFFKYNYSSSSIIKCIILNLSFLPLFLGLGLLASALIFITRKGSAGLGSIVSVLAILSGAYFPLTVFPNSIVKVSKYVNPLHLLLEQSRSILKLGYTDLNFPLFCFGILLIGFLFIFLGSRLFSLFVKIHKKRGEPLILTFR